MFKKLFCWHDYEFVGKVHRYTYIDGGMYGFDGGGFFNVFKVTERCSKCGKERTYSQEQRIE